MAAALPSTPAPAPPVLGGDPTAVFGRRALAFVIDGLIVGVPGVALATSRFERFDATEAGLSGNEFCDRYMDQYSGSACVNIGDTAYFDDGGFDPVGFAPVILAFLVFVVLQGLTGWTFGKLLTGLRTVREDGSVVGVGRALVRWLLMVVDAQPCGLPLVGLITAGTTTGHRRVGDMAAKTYVVRAAAAGAPIAVPGSMPPPSGASAWGAPPPSDPWGTPAPGSWEQPPAAPPAERTEGGWSGPGPQAEAPAARPEPQWDPARNTYIQWDPGRSAWLQWDEASQSWEVIPGQ